MNPEKSNIKLALLHDQGVQWDDWLEARERRMAEMAGAVTALKQCREVIMPPIFSAVSEDVEAGKLTDLAPLQVQSYVTKQLQRVLLALENVQMNFERERIVAEGRAAQLRDIVALTRKQFDAEKAALADFAAKLATGDMTPEGRPALSAAEDIAQRRAAAQAVKVQEGPGLLNQEGAGAVDPEIAPEAAVSVPALPSAKKVPKKRKK